MFSGIGGLDLGLERAGWACRWQVEIDEWRRGILERNWPGVPRYENVRSVAVASEAGVQQLERVDLLTGGFPCQDVSVAGRRAGLAGARSGLFHEFARIADAVRPEFLLVENVPGLLTSNGGRDFGVVLGTLADIGYGVAWRVLDSRFFGVPQRRRRVFIVGALPGRDLGARRASEILAVGASCERHPAKGGAARTEVASTIGGGAPGGGISDDIDRRPMISTSLSGLGSGGPDDNDAQAGRIIPALTSGANRQDDQQSQQLAYTSSGAGWWDEEEFVRLRAQGGGTPQNIITGADARRESRVDDDPRAGSTPASPTVTHSLTSEDHDASEDGTGRGTPLAFNWQNAGNEGYSFGEQTGPIDRSQTKAVGGLAAGVRRLTPVECCRLQGFPDDWLGEPNVLPDSPRYAAMGDAVTVNVAEWIGERLRAEYDSAP